MKNPFKTTKAFLYEPLKYYYNILKGFGALTIEDIDADDENVVLINDYFEKIYCVEIAGAGESIQFFPKTLIDSLCSDFANDDSGELTWVLIKDGLYKKNLIFTRNRKIAKQIEDSTSAKLLTFDEIFDRLLSLYFNNQYDIDWFKRELQQKYKTNLDEEYKNPLNILNSLIIQRVNANYEKVKYYQAIAYDNKKKEEEIKFDINAFFKVNFKGALYTKIIFNTDRMKAELEAQKFNTMGQFKNRDKNILKTLIKSISTHDRIMINTTLQVFEDFGNNISTQIEKCASCTLDIVTRQNRELNNKTPILSYNRDFSKIVQKGFLYNYITYNTKLDSDKPHLVGTNINNSFQNFGFKKATAKHSIPKQHTFLVGTSGAGKTQAANDILKQLLGYDYENKKLYHVGETNHVIFDIKDSFYNIVKKLKEDFPSKVDMNDFDKNSFLYNIVDCDVIERGMSKEADESDIDFSSTLISLILNSGNGENQALTSSESEEFKRTLREIYKKESYERLPVADIRDSHPKEYKELRDLGYKEFTPFDEIKETTFDKFKKPLLHNVINKIKENQVGYKTAQQRLQFELTENLLMKLETIEAMQIFSSYSKLDFKNKDIIYFRTDSILGDDYGYFIFAMQSILSKQIKKAQHKKRMKKQSRPLVFFWFEEARNIFANKLFKEKEVFERIINEWRSYDMVFFPITQEPQHIPDSILNGFEIKMILTSGEDPEEKISLVESLSKRLALGATRKQMLLDLPKYTIQVLYGDGAFTLKFKDDEKFRNLVDT